MIAIAGEVQVRGGIFVTDATPNLSKPDLYRLDWRCALDLCCTAPNARLDITSSHVCSKEPTSHVQRNTKRNMVAERGCCALVRL